MPRVLLAIVMSLGLQIAPAAADPPGADPIDVPAGIYSLDAGRSELQATIGYVGDLARAHLSFTRLTGRFGYAPGAWDQSRVAIEVEAASVTSGMRPLDGSVRRTLDVARYPVIRFVSDRLVPTGPQTAELGGQLTLHGVTRPVALKIVVRAADDGADGDPARVRFSGVGRIRRSAFGVPPPAPFTRDEIDLRFDVEFVRVAAAQPPAT